MTPCTFSITLLQFCTLGLTRKRTPGLCAGLAENSPPFDS